jgi:hypothetical protein
MPAVLYSFRKLSSGRIMFHGFIAPNGKQAAADLAAHADMCPQFGPAHKAGNTIDIEVETDEIPEYEEASLEEFLELDSEDDEDEEDDEEEAADEEDDTIEAT